MCPISRRNRLRGGQEAEPLTRAAAPPAARQNAQARAPGQRERHQAKKKTAKKALSLRKQLELWADWTRDMKVFFMMTSSFRSHALASYGGKSKPRLACQTQARREFTAGSWTDSLPSAASGSDGMYSVSIIRFLRERHAFHNGSRFVLGFCVRPRR